MLRRFIVGGWKITLYSDEYNTDTLILYGSRASAFIAVRISAMSEMDLLPRENATTTMFPLVVS